jgi:hypothetical protein
MPQGKPVKKILHKDRLERYLTVFNAWKKKYTGIKSKYSIRNKMITGAWNKQVEGMSDSDLDDMARDIRKAVYAACNSEWHKESNFKWITPELFLRQDKLDYWVNAYITDHHKPDTKPFKKQRFA